MKVNYPLVVLTTLPDEDKAEQMARKIVDAKLAACVQILPKMKSIYFWDGEIQNEAEHLLFIKTIDEKYPALEEFINANHPYDVPEIIALSAKEVSKKYSDWVMSCLN